MSKHKLYAVVHVASGKFLKKNRPSSRDVKIVRDAVPEKFLTDKLSQARLSNSPTRAVLDNGYQWKDYKTGETDGWWERGLIKVVEYEATPIRDVDVEISGRYG